MDINEEIRFRVVDEMFTDLSPAGPEMLGEKKNADEVDNKRSPYTITVSLSLSRITMILPSIPHEAVEHIFSCRNFEYSCLQNNTVSSNQGHPSRGAFSDIQGLFKAFVNHACNAQDP